MTQTQEKTIMYSKPLYYGLLVFLIAAFFYVALSTVHSFLKIALIAAILFTSGTIIARLTKNENHYGLVIIRGQKGFSLMQKIAEKYPKTSNQLADLGLSLGFGALYSYYLFAKNKTKLLIHVLILIALFALATNTNTGIPREFLILVGVLFGLAGIGIISIFQSAFNIATIPGSPA